MSETAPEDDQQQAPSTLNVWAVFGLGAGVMVVALFPVAAVIHRIWLTPVIVLSITVGILFERSDDDFRSIREHATCTSRCTGRSC
jgi:hypothetical protein